MKGKQRKSQKGADLVGFWGRKRGPRKPPDGILFPVEGRIGAVLAKIRNHMCDMRNKFPASLKRFALKPPYKSLPEIKDFNALCDRPCFKSKAKRYRYRGLKCRRQARALVNGPLCIQLCCNIGATNDVMRNASGAQGIGQHRVWHLART